MKTLDEVFATCPKSIIKPLEQRELDLETSSKMLKRHPKLTRKNLEVIKKTIELSADSTRITELM